MQFPSNEELEIIKQYTLLPFVIQVFQRDLKVIEDSNLKFREPYFQLINQAVRGIEKDYINAKKSIKRIGIKIYEETRSDKGVEWKYIYCGYHHKFAYSTHVLKTEVKRLVAFYLGCHPI